MESQQRMQTKYLRKSDGWQASNNVQSRSSSSLSFFSLHCVWLLALDSSCRLDERDDEDRERLCLPVRQLTTILKIADKNLQHRRRESSTNRSSRTSLSAEMLKDLFHFSTVCGQTGFVHETCRQPIKVF